MNLTRPSGTYIEAFEERDWHGFHDDPKVNKIEHVFIPFVYIFVFIVGLPTNLMAIWVFLFRTKKKNPASILMVSLALAHLLFIIGLPLNITDHLMRNNWIFGETLCKVLVGSFYNNLYSSIIFIAVISVQRYWAVVHPLSNKFNNRVAVCVSVLIWVIVWLLSIPLYMNDQTNYQYGFNFNVTFQIACYDNIYMFENDFITKYFLIRSTVVFILACIVCVVTYVLIFLHLRNSTINSINTENKQKAIRLMIVVLFLFLVSFAPSNILLIVLISKETAGLEDDLSDLYSSYSVALCLSSLNSCIDPFVYYFISNEFKDHVRNMFMCRSERTAEQIKITSSDKQNSLSEDT